tara:strand:- start:8632 stop:8946 length:315 start_codon:yes stop_codon:yes gene_type:complete
MVTLNKRDNLKKESISKNITSSLGLPNLYSIKILNDIIQLLISNLRSGKEMKIKNFGTFLLSNKKKRIGRNPKNNKKYNISERVVAIFKISNNLKARVNKNVSK